MTLWWATLGGLIAWAAHLVLSYLAVALVCGEESRLPEIGSDPALIAITMVTLVAAVHAAVVALGMWRRGRETVRRLAFGGLLLDLLGAVAILAGGVIPAFVRSC